MNRESESNLSVEPQIREVNEIMSLEKYLEYEREFLKGLKQFIEEISKESLSEDPETLAKRIHQIREASEWLSSIEISQLKTGLAEDQLSALDQQNLVIQELAVFMNDPKMFVGENEEATAETIYVTIEQEIKTLEQDDAGNEE